MTFSKYFEETYYNKLLTPNGNNPQRNRAPSMLLAFEELEKMNLGHYNIAEVGTCRSDHGDLCFGDDGASTVIFDDFAYNYELFSSQGKFISIDINNDNCNYARSKVRSKNTQIVCADSVKYLWSLPESFKINLLYLDSFDVEKSNPLPAQHHALMELTASMKNLQKGSLVLIDDFRAFFDNGETGKGWLIKQFVDKTGMEILIDNYQLLFRIK